MSAKASEHAAIRRACAGDAAALTTLMHATAAYRGRYAAMLAGYTVTPAQIVRDEVFVYAPTDAILGFYSLKRDGELDLLFVADAAQGRGIGAALVTHLREHARACGLDSIRIVAHPPAEGFYLRLGARRTGTAAPAGRVTWARPLLVLDLDAQAARSRISAARMPR